MLLKLLLIAAVVLALLIVFIATRPAAFHVTRSKSIAAPPAAVFPHVNNFHKWTAWSPWEKIDPALQRTYSGAEAGVGAVYAWKGNSQVGQGSMTILESRPNELIKFRLDFVKPFAGTNYADFTFTPTGSGTEVTWTMTGSLNFITKGIGLVMSMDKMIGGPFDEGLNNLRAITEASR
jgi:hypothetical protein